ncbi:type II secretion system F family protein [Cellulomonas sp. S1-8]|uniref:type II secretion system F family protein n=1 Tax=Cellulomonas sp. S1-8 TaxID=2904790 RepID=UPI002244AAC6|nr:type II secretion system F family protein [Cellulomonas sp. S1-8]UZN02440.1 type II secretion system F family protein [Cellulomonas sp. S1-8]
MSVVVGVLVALGVVALAGPAPRRAGGRARSGGHTALGGGPAGTGVPARPAAREGRVRLRRRREAEGLQTDLASLLHAVAAQLRAGVPPSTAWVEVLGSAVHGQVPDVDALAGVVGARGSQRTRVRAAVVGVRVATETGAPLADVLEDLADAVAADAEQAGELDAALAGPRATARVLTLLPVLGLLVGTAMGAQPWQVLTDGGLGTGLAVAGLGLVAAGRLWVGVLLRRAGAP